MNLNRELASLQELPPPPLPALWPQTWGWLVLALLAFAVIGTALVIWLRRRRANRYRREAALALESLWRQWQANPEDTGPLRDIPELLRRAVFSRLGRNVPGVTTATGAHWQQLLNRMARTPLSPGFTDQLALLAYGGDRELQTLDVTRLVAECRHWLESHHDPV
ncbi:DUF4381 domain-containing protein [Marinobacter mobilis]|uniref:DUF4381 domain-containing protein n=1 Tax=Marinobacter mobilis TaxID=488533 RepID=A0A1H2XY52_9GAMM|nr:DUF4381 domain-containing protein [Marinobacter mobilis]SDW97730.1 protein of unknown function [Marinobacter mobilis]